MTNLKLKLNKILKGFVIAVLLHSSLSYFHIIYQIVSSSLYEGIRIGFPFVYFRFFLIKGNDFLNFSWNGQSILYNLVFFFFLLFLVFKLYSHQFKK